MLEIKIADIVDVDEIAELHIRVFPGFFLTSMGKVFLVELYKAFLTPPHGLLLIARDSGKLVGFAAGTLEADSFFAELRRRRYFSFLIKAVPSILRNPVPVIKKLWSALTYRGDPPSLDSSGALLSSIGVDSDYRGSGLAGQLTEEFENIVADHGVNRVYLTTDALGNERVNAFYKKSGYQVECSFEQSKNRIMYRYIKSVQPRKNNDC